MTTFADAFVELKPSAEGGRSSPIYSGYRPHLCVRGGDGEYLGVEFVSPDGPLLPGTSSDAIVRFMYEPQVSYELLTVGAEFDIREGGKTIGGGQVTRVWVDDKK